MTSSTPEAPEPGTQVDLQRLADEVMAEIGDEWIGIHNEYWVIYPTGWKEATHTPITVYPMGDVYADQEGELDRRALTAIWAALARQSPTVALTNDRDEEETR